MKRRLDRIEACLPTPARVIAWLRDAIAGHESIEDYADRLATQGVASGFPLIGVLTAAQAAARQQAGSRKEVDLRDATTRASVQPARLILLVRDINLELLGRRAEFEARLRFLAMGVDPEHLLLAARAAGLVAPGDLLCGAGSEGLTLVAHADAVRSELCALDEAVRLVSKQYFGGRTILFARQQQGLSTWLASAGALHQCLRVTDSALAGRPPDRGAVAGAPAAEISGRAQELSRD